MFTEDIILVDTSYFDVSFTSYFYSNISICVAFKFITTFLKLWFLGNVNKWNMVKQVVRSYFIFPGAMFRQVC